jgi:hypothetical protein
VHDLGRPTADVNHNERLGAIVRVTQAKDGEEPLLRMVEDGNRPLKS